MVAIVTLLVVVGLVFGGAAGTVNVVQGSLPGSALYTLKLEVEDIQLAHADTPETQARRSVALAQARVVEARRLAERGEPIPAALVERYREHLALALNATDRLSELSQTRMRAWLARQLVAQLRTIAHLAQHWQQGWYAQNADAMQQMMQAVQRALAHISGEQDKHAPDKDAPDDDDDDVLDVDDNCPATPNPDQADGDSDGVGDACDNCPADPLKTEPGICGCGVADTDSDNDGTADCNDGCPADPLKTEPGICGCGVVDTDSDGDGTPDCRDNCPADPNKTKPGACGCGVADTDSDGDGTPDCHDDQGDDDQDDQGDDDQDDQGDDDQDDQGDDDQDDQGDDDDDDDDN